jgi:signal transduction histidine kinase
MSNINDVRAAEKRLQEMLDAILHSQTRDLARLSAELTEVTDDYTRVVGELRF